MDTKYKLKITPAASRDLENIYEYIKNTLSASKAATNIVHEITKKLKSVTSFPYMYELSRDRMLCQKGYRKIVINNYIALYTVDENKKEVVITRIFYGSMNYSNHL